MTKRLIKFVGYLFILSLWLFVIVLALELIERLRWEYIERTNKYIGIRKGRIPFNEWDPDEKSEESVQYGEGKNLLKPENLLVGDSFCLAPPTLFEKWSYRLSYYISSSEEIKKCFKYVYGLHECDLEVDAESLKFENIRCFDVYDESQKNTLISLILGFNSEKIRSGNSVIESVDSEDGKNYLLYFYFRGGVGNRNKYNYTCFVIPQNSEKWFNPLLEATSINEIFEIPYFLYLPHRSLTSSAFRTNNYGFRDYDFVVPKPEGILRILCIGASTTEEGVSNKETYPKFLESILEDYFKTDKIEVFNCGISGMTLNRHIAKLPEYVLFQPDIVIIYEGINDIVYNLFTQMFDQLPTVIRYAYLFSQFSRVYLRYLSYFDYPIDEIEKRLDNDYISALRILVDSFTKEGVLVAISSVGVPYRNNLSKEEKDYMDYYYFKEWGWINSTFEQYCNIMKLWNKKLRELCDKENLIYVPFAENVPASTKYFGDICHLRQKGIMLKAQVMAETLIPIIENILTKTGGSKDSVN